MCLCVCVCARACVREREREGGGAFLFLSTIDIMDTCHVFFSRVCCCRKLIDESGTTFEVDTSNENFEDDPPCYDKEELLKCVKYEYVNPDSDEDDTELGSLLTPFRKIASKMINLTEDGKVKKKVC